MTLFHLSDRGLQIPPAELAEKLRSQHPPLVLDVRGADEHAIVALPGSVLIPLGELGSRAKELIASKDREVVVYCHHGMRSLRGAQILRRLGFENARSLTGGIDRWAVEIDPSMRRY